MTALASGKSIKETTGCAGGRKYEFLASSTSQLRSHGVWFYSRDANGFTADDVRAAIGDLSSIRIPSKYMARLGQAFSQSMGYVTVPQACTRVDRDILLKGRKPGIKYNFSDGVGRISPSVLARVSVRGTKRQRRLQR